MPRRLHRSPATRRATRRLQLGHAPRSSRARAPACWADDDRASLAAQQQSFKDCAAVTPGSRTCCAPYLDDLGVATWVESVLHTAARRTPSTRRRRAPSPLSTYTCSWWRQADDAPRVGLVAAAPELRRRSDRGRQAGRLRLRCSPDAQAAHALRRPLQHRVRRAVRAVQDLRSRGGLHQHQPLTLRYCRRRAVAQSVRAEDS